jgi:phosphonatase-like hydrolase
MQSFKLAVFDIAGTTVRDKDFVAVSFIDAFKKFNVDLSVSEINPLMGFKKTEAIAFVLKDKAIDLSDELISAIHDDFIDRMVSFYSTSEHVEPLPYVHEIFTFLRQYGVQIAINSGFPKVIVDVIIDKMGWKANRLIDFSIASDEVPKGRPHPDMIHELMKISGIHDSKQVIKVGDTMVDIQEGRMADCGLVVGVTTGAYSRAELSTYSPDYIIDSLKELEQFVV